MDPVNGNAAAILAAAKKFGETELFNLGPHDDVDVLIVPDGRKVQSIKPLLDEYLSAPERRKGTATATTIRSFVDLTNRFKDTESAIFADNSPKTPRLIAVLDYNPAEASDPDHPGKARFGQHRVDYAFPVSSEWAAWTGKNGTDMGQGDFAQFLEDRIADVGNPGEAMTAARTFAAQVGITLASPQRLMELSRGLSIRVNAKVTQAVKLSSGEAQIGFEETHEEEGGGPVKIPGGFAIRIPVFRGGEAFEIPVRLKYRAQGGAIIWSYSLQRTDNIWDLVIAEACQFVEKETGLPLFYGSPEK
jgi:uncharacterized protein YfdQ (DUF2303 family)